jgi:hypothetical protein
LILCLPHLHQYPLLQLRNWTISDIKFGLKGIK